MFSPLHHLRVVVSCLLAFTLLTSISHAQNVTTWHNDYNRTGWQQTETILTPSTVNQSSFGLLWQWGSPSSPLAGRIYAQPLAVTGVHTTYTGCKPCDLVFIATEKDMLYAFKSSSNSQNAVWKLDLAGYVGGAPVQCSALPPGLLYDPCSSGLLGPYVGVTGTPVVDASINPNTLYVAAAVYFSGPPAYISFYLFAVDITTGLVRGTPAPVTGTVSGQAPSQKCSSTNPLPGETVSFDYNHIQRSALLLLPVGGVNTLYVAFAPGDGESENGWMFGYSFNSGVFSQTAIFSSTPFGTGGGIWQSGAGPASDGNYIYAATGNGTFSYVTPGPPSTLEVLNYGDSLLKRPW